MSTPLHQAAQKALAALEVCTGRTTGAGVMRVRAIAEVREALAHVDQTNTSPERVQNPPGNVHVMQMALDAHLAMREWINAVPQDTVLPAMPGMDGDWLDQVEEALRAALAAPHYPLPDSLYPNSKDWLAGDYAERVDWLHTMYESKRQELDQCYEQMAKMMPKPVQPERSCATCKKVDPSELSCMATLACTNFDQWEPK